MANYSAIQSGTVGAGNIMSFIAGATLTGKEGYLVKISGVDATNKNRGKVIVSSASTDPVIGVVTEGAASGGDCYVKLLAGAGTIRCVAGGSITAGARVMPHTDGTAVTAATTGNLTIGVALNTVVSGDYVEIAVRTDYQA